MTTTRVYLIGFMGCGKSSVGTALAARLRIPRIELDDIILRKSGCESIPDIFERHGEPHFRSLESEALAETLEAGSAIVSAGGGIIGSQMNRDMLARSGGKVVYLSAEFETVESRLEGDVSRPKFRDRAKAVDLYAARIPLYEGVAHLIVETDHRTIDEVTEEVARLLSESL